MKTFKDYNSEILEESLKDWIRNIVFAAGLLGSEKELAAKKITVYPDGRAVYTDTGKPVINKKSETINPKTALMKVKANTPEDRKNLLQKMAIASGIKGQELTHFLAQASHETLDFKELEEIGSLEKFEKKYGPNTSKGKILGNTQSGDGSKYRGRGFLQLTGKYNYDKIGKMLDLDLVNNPGLISKHPAVAAATAIAYWKWRVAPSVKNFNTKGAVEKVTKQITGTSKEKHLERRKKQLKKFKR